jgi:hypothetical protein
MRLFLTAQDLFGDILHHVFGLITAPEYAASQSEHEI